MNIPHSNGSSEDIVCKRYNSNPKFVIEKFNFIHDPLQHTDIRNRLAFSVKH